MLFLLADKKLNLYEFRIVDVWMDGRIGVRHTYNFSGTFPLVCDRKGTDFLVTTMWCAREKLLEQSYNLDPTS